MTLAEFMHEAMLETAIEQMIASGLSLDAASKQFQQLYCVGLVRACDGNQLRAAAKGRAHRNTIARLTPKDAIKKIKATCRAAAELERPA